MTGPTRFLSFLFLALALGGCGSGGARDDGPAAGSEGVAASCALAVQYEGHTYLATGVEVAPRQGKSLVGGTFPPCDDTGGAKDPAPAEEVQIAELEGVDPSVAILLVGRDDVVLVRDGVDTDALPPEVTRLLQAAE